MRSPLNDDIDQWSLIEESSHCASVYLPNYFEALVPCAGLYRTHRIKTPAWGIRNLHARLTSEQLWIYNMTWSYDTAGWQGLSCLCHISVAQKSNTWLSLWVYGLYLFSQHLTKNFWKSTCHCLHYHIKSLSVLRSKHCWEKETFRSFWMFPDPTHLSIQPFAFEFLLFSHSL